MDPTLEQFWEDLESGEVHMRDRWQISLKSEFFPRPDKAYSQCTQEFYFFIPSSLQINKSTYSNTQFYQDQTNLIRYKTPQFSFEELFDPRNPLSPLTCMFHLCKQEETPENRISFTEELKLFGGVVRSTLRAAVKKLLDELEKDKTVAQRPEFEGKCHALLEQIAVLHRKYDELKALFLDTWNDSHLYRHILYIDEFISEEINYYLTGLLELIHLAQENGAAPIEKPIKEALNREDFLTKHGITPTATKGGVLDTREAESIIHKRSLLIKYVLDGLQLSTNRFSLVQNYQNWIGGISAGVAMLIYLLLFVTLGNVFVINSLPFVMLTILIYILKDRLKEWMKILSYRHFSRWFPDYTTDIFSSDRKKKLGTLRESFSFIDEPQLSEELRKLRKAEFHSVLETVQRPENVLFYKRDVVLNTHKETPTSRFKGLNVIFRYNIQAFLKNASEPFEEHLTIDPETQNLIALYLPKVYHLNLIIRTTIAEPGKTPEITLKKLRIIIDKNGIKRIEHISKREVI